MSIYKSYLLKNEFWAKKGNLQHPDQEQVFIKHDVNVGGIYAKIICNPKGVVISFNGDTQFFNNFDKIDEYLAKISQNNEFNRILNRRMRSSQLRTLKI